MKERTESVEDFPFSIDITVDKKNPPTNFCCSCLNFEKSKHIAGKGKDTDKVKGKGRKGRKAEGRDRHKRDG